MKNIVDEKQFRTKEAIKIISPLNASWELLVSEVLKLVKLILLVPTTNVASERMHWTFCRVKTYLWSSMTQEPVSSCLIVITYNNYGIYNYMYDIYNLHVWYVWYIVNLLFNMDFVLN